MTPIESFGNLVDQIGPDMDVVPTDDIASVDHACRIAHAALLVWKIKNNRPIAPTSEGGVLTRRYFENALREWRQVLDRHQTLLDRELRQWEDHT